MKIKIFHIAIFLALLTSCKKQPTYWGSDWVVPLVNDSLGIADYINDSTLEVNADGTIQVVLNRKLLNLDLSKIAGIPDTSINQEYTIQLNSLVVQPGTSFINNIKEHVISLDDATLFKVKVKSGEARVRVNNPVATDVIFTISLPGVTKEGIEFVNVVTVPAGTQTNPGEKEIVLDFSGYAIDLKGVNGDLYNRLQTKMTVASDPNGETVTITPLDKFKFDINFENLSFDYGKGYFGNIVYEETEIVDIPELRKIVGGNLNIEDLNLTLTVSNGLVVPGQVRINKFESINSNQNTQLALEHPYFGQLININPASGTWDNLIPSKVDFDFNESSGNLADFIGHLGDKYEVEYKIELNPHGNTSAGNNEVHSISELNLELNSNFPLKVGVQGLIVQDTFQLNLGDEEKMLSIQEGRLVLKTENSFPYGADVKLFLLDEFDTVLKEVESEGQLSAAPLNNEIMTGHGVVEDELIFFINKDTSEALKQTANIMVRAEFNSAQYQNNMLYSNAAIKFSLMGYFTLKASI